MVPSYVPGPRYRPRGPLLIFGSYPAYPLLLTGRAAVGRGHRAVGGSTRALRTREV